MSRIFNTFIALAMFTFFSSVATADVIVFSNSTSFNTATIGSPRFTEDFQGSTAGTSFRTAPVNFNGNFSLQQVNLSGTPTIFENQIATSSARLFTNFGITAVDLTFSAPVFAFGADFSDAVGGGGELLNINFFNNANMLVLTNSFEVGDGFFGFSNSELISRIRFTSRLNTGILSPGAFDNGEAFNLDNVVGVTTSSVSQPGAVPEPATMVLLGTGLTGVGAAAMSKRRTAEKNEAA